MSTASNREKWNARVQLVMQETGWDRASTVERLKSARASFGIKSKAYCRFKLYKYPEAELNEIYQVLKIQRDKNKENKEACYQSTMESRGCTWEEAKTEVERRRFRLGIRYWEYLKYKVYNMPEDVLEVCYRHAVTKEEFRKKTEHRERAYEESEHAIQKVMEKTGWTRDETLNKMEEARQAIGCSYQEFFYKEYFIFHLYEMMEAQQKRIALYHHSRMVTQKYMVDHAFAKILKNKEATNLYFSEMVKRAWCINTKVSYEEFVSAFQNCKRVIFKPVKGHKGEGIRLYDLSLDLMRLVYEDIKAAEPGIVEEYVVQHPDISALSPNSVNTLRVVTICLKDRPVADTGANSVILYSVMRIGGGHSIIDNFHRGGMCAVVDLKSGRLITDGTNMEGDVFVHHPYTGRQIKDFEIPFFKEALDMVRKACDKSLTQGYIGWDVAITATGPELIEANMVPGIDLLSTPYGVYKEDSLHILEPFM